jgi:hypothetical protein
MAEPKQRDVMRRLYTEQHGDEERTIREYALAEQRGQVPRASNQYQLDAARYARALLRDGMAKGWLAGTPVK